MNSIKICIIMSFFMCCAVQSSQLVQKKNISLEMAFKQQFCEAFTILIYYPLCGFSTNCLNNLKTLVTKNVDVNEWGEEKDVPLVVAAIYNRLEIVQELLKSSTIVVNKRDGNGITALMEAVESRFSMSTNNEKIIVALLQAGADIFAQDNNGRSVLSRAQVRVNNEYRAGNVRAIIESYLFLMKYEDSRGFFQPILHFDLQLPPVITEWHMVGPWEKVCTEPKMDFEWV